MFELKTYTAPNFEEERFVSAPNAVLVPAPFDGVAPEGYHALSIFPEYFKIDGAWLLAEESRMDCVPVYENGKPVYDGENVRTVSTETVRYKTTPSRYHEPKARKDTDIKPPKKKR